MWPLHSEGRKLVAQFAENPAENRGREFHIGRMGMARFMSDWPRLGRHEGSGNIRMGLKLRTERPLDQP
jgi:hypothetical protein